ncbi:universal stress protein [Streptomyces somaliensis DSM 40738]|uniref:Universal stress protein n=1 Tax=Streptomyces somaliensis (strain ATCC 33201 / DSM 40738 / JCM 12659 / KCTC 9044 / NCTC 11332 / NRRL B-12077 / IP 733) TaxID=1134445 RepID=A0AA44IDF0_STRE0|nr:universal stress protein [Streptomyces somaliensis]MCQ0021627.1 universal stress protein [Streptomyces somaliensis DSM 40738]NKY14649.1 universal stress protein [Streptomyces somaliensis DSM 40738]
MAQGPTTRAITVGVDGSPESLAAAAWAAREAALRGLPLRLVHAWLWQPLDIPVEQEREAEARRAQGVLDGAEAQVRRLHPDVPVVSRLVADTPVPALVEAGGTSEMLVVGSRGRGALLGFLLGSYGQQVIATATCPVVAVRAPREDGAGAPGGEVVVGQQGGPEESAAVLGFAFGAAAARGVGVRAVRAWSLPSLYAYSPGSMALADEAGGLEPFERKALADALAPWRERYPDVPVTEHVELGSGGQVLLSVASGAGLMVVGRRARQAPVGPRIGSVAHAVLHHAPSPVAVVPHG